MPRCSPTCSLPHTTQELALRALNDSAKAVADVAQLGRTVEDQFSKQTTEIIRLITTDPTHEVKLATFERHTEKSTDKAVQSVETAAKKAGASTQRSVAVLVGAIVAIATAINWLMQHWPAK